MKSASISLRDTAGGRDRARDQRRASRRSSTRRASASAPSGRGPDSRRSATATGAIPALLRNKVETDWPGWPTEPGGERGLAEVRLEVDGEHCGTFGCAPDSGSRRGRRRAGGPVQSARPSALPGRRRRRPKALPPAAPSLARFQRNSICSPLATRAAKASLASHSLFAAESSRAAGEGSATWRLTK